MNKHTELPWHEDSCAGQLLIIDKGNRLIAKTYNEQAATEIQFYANNHARLVKALQEVTATLAWVAHGECRAIHDGPIMSSGQAQEMARTLLAQLDRAKEGLYE